MDDKGTKRGQDEERFPIFGKVDSKEMMTQVELEKAMIHVDKAFHDKIGSNFIDVLAGKTTRAQAGECRNPVIRRYTVMVDGNVVWYWSFDNLFSPFFKQQMFASGNSNPYMSSKEVNPGAGKDGNRYLHFADKAGDQEIFHMKRFFT